MVSTWHTSSRKNTQETAGAFTGMTEVESAYVRCSFLLLVEVRAARARSLWITLHCDDEIEAEIYRSAGERRVHEGWSLGLHQSQPSAVTAQHLWSWRFIIDERQRGPPPPPLTPAEDRWIWKETDKSSDFGVFFLKKKHEEGPTEERIGSGRNGKGQIERRQKRKWIPFPSALPRSENVLIEASCSSRVCGGVFDGLQLLSWRGAETCNEERVRRARAAAHGKSTAFSRLLGNPTVFLHHISVKQHLRKHAAFWY